MSDVKELDIFNISLAVRHYIMITKQKKELSKTNSFVTIILYECFVNHYKSTLGWVCFKKYATNRGFKSIIFLIITCSAYTHDLEI